MMQYIVKIESSNVMAHAVDFYVNNQYLVTRTSYTHICDTYNYKYILSFLND